MPFVLVAYDISDDKRRATVCERLKAMGFSMVQKSLYVARGGSSLAKDVYRALQRLVDRSRDSVVVMVVPREVLQKSMVIGVNRLVLNERSYAII